MTDIKDFILQLEDTALSLEEQQAALAMIEQSLIETKQTQEKTLEESSTLIVDAVKLIEDKLDNQFSELKRDPKLKGPKGDQGIKGEKGRDGRDGIDGHNGKDGKDGLDGPAGKDGRYVVNVEVDIDDTLLVTLSDGSTIKTTKEIKGPKGDQGPQGLRGSPGAGVAAGGTVGQVLVKNGDNDYDTAWTNTPGIDLGSPDAIGDVTPNTGKFTDLTDTSLTAGRVTYAGTGGNLTDSANFTYDGTNLIAGAIQNTPIGATTPNTGAFTTLTAQTEVLKGTGQNLFLQSNTFNTTWTLQQTSATIGQTDPFGGSNAWTILADGTTNGHSSIQSVSCISGIAYTQSWYVKKGTNNFVQIRFGSALGGAYANFDLNNGVVGTLGQASGNTPTSAITSIGNGWYRCSISVVVNASASSTIGIYIVTSASAGGAESNSLATSVLAYGAQVEIGSVVNTYIPTTTTAVYGTPSLSFSGVAGIGLQSDGALYVQPVGTGGLQAQTTTSTTTGGNARGSYAVDWQTQRTSATHVASGSNSVVGGGSSNIASGTFGAVMSGLANTAIGTVSSVLGGQSNAVIGNYSGIVTGTNNSASGYYNFIGGGASNSGTANAAVTTQATATNGVTSGSTAVTLSGSNAAIKVGQIVTGTGIVSTPLTYVAAISGTSLTLSQNANATGTPTLSFFTPHGVVVGGGNNQATGSYSFIGGGGDAGNTANRNTASGDWSVVVGGGRNTASGIASFVGAGGFNGTNFGANTASGTSSFIGSGLSNTASGNSSVVAGGFSNTSNSVYGAICGGSNGTTRGVTGYAVFPAHNSPITATLGVSQAALIVLGTQTTDATATVIRSDSAAAGTTNQVIMPNNSAYYVMGTIIAGVTGGGNTSSWEFKGAIKRGANAASTALVAAITPTLIAQDVGAATWAVAIAADTTNGGLKVTVTGQAATTIRWVCKVETVEMTF